MGAVCGCGVLLRCVGAVCGCGWSVADSGRASWSRILVADRKLRNSALGGGRRTSLTRITRIALNPRLFNEFVLTAFAFIIHLSIFNHFLAIPFV